MLIHSVPSIMYKTCKCIVFVPLALKLSPLIPKPFSVYKVLKWVELSNFATTNEEIKTRKQTNLFIQEQAQR